MEEFCPFESLTLSNIKDFYMTAILRVFLTIYYMLENIALQLYIKSIY